VERARWLRGYTGRGVGVAVLDSGVSPHSALRNRVVAAFNFTAHPDNTAIDRYGHGTHVAGTIAGEGETYPGMAPGAHIVSLRVLEADGSGETSSVIDAINWAIEHKAEYALQVINLSLGHPVFESSLDDPLCQAVQRAVDAGYVVVAAAGNMGKAADGRPVVGAIISPANSPRR
jgi:serine protease AprX